jgi:hypothetical protein
MLPPQICLVQSLPPLPQVPVYCHGQHVIRDCLQASAAVLVPQSPPLAVIPPGSSSSRRRQQDAANAPQKYLLPDAPHDTLGRAHGARPDGDLVGPALLQRPPGIDRVTQAPVLLQHARAPEHLRQVVVREGCQEADVVKLAHPRCRTVRRLAAAATATAEFGWQATTNTSVTAAAAQRRPQVGDRYLRPLVEVHNQCRSRPPCRLPPGGGRGNVGRCPGHCNCKCR